MLRQPEQDQLALEQKARQQNKNHQHREIIDDDVGYDDSLEYYSIPVSTTTNVWFDGTDERPLLYIPKQIAAKHRINKPSKVAVYDLEQGIFNGFCITTKSI